MASVLGGENFIVVIDVEYTWERVIFDLLVKKCQ